MVTATCRTRKATLPSSRMAAFASCTFAWPAAAWCGRDIDPQERKHNLRGKTCKSRSSVQHAAAGRGAGRDPLPLRCRVEFIAVGAIVLAVGVGLALIAISSSDHGQKTCRECGGGLPVIRLANQPQAPALGDWACPKCGTQFDRQAKARNQART